MQLSPQQEQAVKLISSWLRSGEREFVLSGYAGTGKTTIAKHIENDIKGSVIYATYTGKAANVLRDKGCMNTGTIHSYLYKYEGKDHEGKLIFGLNRESELRTAALAVIDEYSMVPQDLINDLRRMCKRILWLGDPFQLPPLFGDQEITPDFVLTEIHRQALENPVLKAATDVRNGVALKHGDYGKFIYNYKHNFEKQDFFNADQCLVGRHATRKKWNKVFITSLYGEFVDLEKPLGMGERIICRKNNKEMGIYNGMIGTCDGARQIGDKFYIDFKADGNLYEDVLIFLPPFSQNIEKSKQQPSDRKFNCFDFAYGITVHASQGSEWDNILIYNEPVGKTEEIRRRWLYTALTRARETAKLVDPS